MTKIVNFESLKSLSHLSPHPTYAIDRKQSLIIKTYHIHNLCGSAKWKQRHGDV